MGQNDRIRTVRVRTLILNIGHTAILRSAVLLLASLAWEGNAFIMSTGRRFSPAWRLSAE